MTGEAAEKPETDEPEDKKLSKDIAKLTIGEFVETFGGIYEHSPWVAEEAYAQHDTILTVKELHTAMKAAVAAASQEKQMALIKAHPELACKEADAKKLTEASTSEQKGAGLDACTPTEFAEFQKLNGAYREKFGFPFIIAVKGLDRQKILAAFRKRLENGVEDEFDEALEQIDRIAFFRLMALP